MTTTSTAPTSADVVVVGGGPAGSATARLLALHGHDVLLLERRPFPRAKPCGDCLSPQSNLVLERLGLLQHVLEQQPARIGGWRIVGPDGESFAADFAAAALADRRTDTAIALPRARFDQAMLDGARSAGAGIVLGARVTNLLLDSDGRVFGVSGVGPDGAPFRTQARIVIGADGLRSVVARRLGLVRRPPRLRKLSLTLHVTADATGFETRYGCMFVARGATLGVAAVGQCTAGRTPLNLTLVLPAQRLPGVSSMDFFRATLARMNSVPTDLIELAHSAEPNSTLLASGPFDWPTRTTICDGAALTGDAAGYFDPFTGQGIYQALRAAELLAPVVDQALRNGPAIVHERLLRPYAQARASLINEARLLQQIVELVTARPWLASAVIRRLAAAPLAARTLIAATGDLRPARVLLLPAVLASFIRVSSPHGDSR